MSIRIKPYIYSVLITLGLGIISAVILGDSTEIYRSINRPPLSPPSWVFPVVWTILYITMGIALGMIWSDKKLCRDEAIKWYFLQLVINILWPLFFFNAGWYVFSLLWIIILDITVIITIIKFYRCKPNAGLLLIPYLVWILFATYLNAGIVLLNSWW